MAITCDISLSGLVLTGPSSGKTAKQLFFKQHVDYTVICRQKASNCLVVFVYSYMLHTLLPGSM